MPELLSRFTWKEALQAMIDGELPHPPICETMNFRLIEVGDGRVLQEGAPGKHHQNPDGSIQGGWAFTLLDCVTFCAASTVLPVGVGATTVETKVNFARRITPASGLMRAEGVVTSQGKRIITCQGRVSLSTDGPIVALGTSTIMVIG